MMLINGCIEEINFNNFTKKNCQKILTIPNEMLNSLNKTPTFQKCNHLMFFSSIVKHKEIQMR